MLPAPPPDPVRGQPATPAAMTDGIAVKRHGKTVRIPRNTEPSEGASEAEPAFAVEWDPRARTVRCDDAALTIPAALAVYVRQNGDEVAVVPPGSPPGGALLVIPIGDLDEPIKKAAQFAAYERRLLQIPDAMARLHAMVSGKELGEDHGADIRTGADGLIDIAYADARTPDMVWRLGAAYAGGCVFLSLELVRPDAAQRFVPMLQGLCAGKPSRCRKQVTMPFPIESQEEEEK